MHIKVSVKPAGQFEYTDHPASTTLAIALISCVDARFNGLSISPCNAIAPNQVSVVSTLGSEFNAAHKPPGIEWVEKLSSARPHLHSLN
jgi:hypothetical protein